jgi:hypothetical protein
MARADQGSQRSARTAALVQVQVADSRPLGLTRDPAHGQSRLRAQASKAIHSPGAANVLLAITYRGCPSLPGIRKQSHVTFRDVVPVAS